MQTILSFIWNRLTEDELVLKQWMALLQSKDQYELKPILQRYSESALTPSWEWRKNESGGRRKIQPDWKLFLI